MRFKSGFESRESQFNTAGGSEFQVRGAAVLNIVWQMMSVEMARTAVGRTTIECCVRWCATRCAGQWCSQEIFSEEQKLEGVSGRKSHSRVLGRSPGRESRGEAPQKLTT